MLKKLLPGVLALAMVAGVNAQDVEKKEKEEAKVAAFIDSAVKLGFTKSEIVAAVEKAVEETDENGVTTLSLTLNNDQKKISIVVGGVAVAAVIGASFYYRDGYVPFGALFKKAPAPAPEPAPENPAPAPAPENPAPAPAPEDPAPAPEPAA